MPNFIENLPNIFKKFFRKFLKFPQKQPQILKIHLLIPIGFTSNSYLS